MVDLFNPCRRVESCGPPSYGAGEDYFTIRLWIKGCMQRWGYVGGECHFFDWCHLYKVTFQQMDNWLVRLGCVDVVRYYYRPLYASLSLDVKEMDDEHDLHAMCVRGTKDKKIDVYVKHLRDESDMEAMEFGRSSLKKLNEVCQNHWDSFVERIDGSFFIYRRRNNEEESEPNPGCCRRLFGDRVIDIPFVQCANEQSDVNYVDEEKILTDEDIVEDVVGDDDEDFIDVDYMVEEDDEDYDEVITHHSGGGGRVSRSQSNQANATSKVRIDVPLEGEYAGESEYSDDSELHSIQSDTDDDGIFRANRHGLEFIAEKHMDNPVLQEGLKFQTFMEFKKAVKAWGIRNRYQPWFSTNDRSRCIARCCKDKKNCTFYIYAAPVSREDPTIQIKTLRLQHTCGKVFKNFHMTAEWLAQKYVGHLRANPQCNDAGLIDMVQRDTTYTISRAKAWRIKNKCLNWIYGEEEKQYQRLMAYKNELEMSNPGSVVELWTERCEFKGFYVCLAPLKESFKRFLRPIICLDGCWLKGTYEGQLLSAVCIDPNDCMYPVAWAVVLTESRQTWTWFLQLLQMSLDLDNSYGITFMSDRQKGLIGAVKDLFPNAEHRHCVRHMYTNFRGKHPGKEMKDIIWKAARATYPLRFNEAMDELKEKSVEARAWFDHPDRPIGSWTKAFFREDPKCDILLNNLCECFNSYILDTRDKAIISMLEMIKNRIMTRIYSKKKLAEKWHSRICPKILKKLEKTAELLPLYTPHYSGGPNVSVVGGDGPYICNMQDQTCTCRRWQLNGLPCAHALASIIHNNELVDRYVSPYYSVERYKLVYNLYINPSNKSELWIADSNLDEMIPPPKRKKKRGRKPMKRRQEAEEIEAAIQRKKKEAADRRSFHGLYCSGVEEESRIKVSRKGKSKATCGLCGLKGHNRRKCVTRNAGGDSSGRNDPGVITQDH